MKRFIILLSVLSLTITTCVSAEADITVTGEAVVINSPKKETRYFTLDEAVSYALENSYDLKAKKADTDAAEISLLQAQTAKYNLNRSPLGANLETGPYIGTGYMVNAAQVGVNVAKRAYKQAEYELRGKVEKSFYTYISLVEKIKNAETSMKSAETRYNEANRKFENGTISQLDMTSFKLAYDNTKITYNALVRSKDVVLMSFKNTIGYPVNDPVELTGAFERKAMDDTPVEAALAASKKNITCLNLQEAYDLAVEKYTIDTRYYSSQQFERRNSIVEFAEAEASYKKNSDAIQIQVYNAYSTMLTKYDTLSYMDDSFDYMQKQVEAQRIRYEQGLVTAQDYIETIQKLDELHNNIKDAEIEAFGAVLDYRATYTYEYIEQ